MSYVLSAVILDPHQSSEDIWNSLQVQKVTIKRISNRSDAQWKACYLKALWQRLGVSFPSVAVYLFVNDDGYLTSAPFVDVPENFEDLAKIFIPYEFRQEVSQILETLLNASNKSEILIFCEPTYGPVGSDPEKRYENYSVEEPMCLKEFWVQHDLGGLLEETIYRVKL